MDESPHGPFLRESYGPPFGSVTAPAWGDALENFVDVVAQGDGELRRGRYGSRQTRDRRHCGEGPDDLFVAGPRGQSDLRRPLIGHRRGTERHHDPEANQSKRLGIQSSDLVWIEPLTEERFQDGFVVQSQASKPALRFRHRVTPVRRGNGPALYLDTICCCPHHLVGMKELSALDLLLEQTELS